MKKIIACIFIILLSFQMYSCTPSIHTPRGTFKGLDDPAWPWGARYIVVETTQMDELKKLIEQTERFEQKDIKYFWQAKHFLTTANLLYALSSFDEKQDRPHYSEIWKETETFLSTSDQKLVQDEFVYASAFPKLRPSVYKIASLPVFSGVENRLFAVIKRHGDRAMIDDALAFGSPSLKTQVREWLNEYKRGLGNPYFYPDWWLFYRPVFETMSDEQIESIYNGLRMAVQKIPYQETIDRILISGSLNLRDESEVSLKRAERCYKILKLLPSTMLRESISRTTFIAMNDLPLIIFYIKLGVGGTEQHLINILDMHEAGSYELSIAKINMSPVQEAYLFLRPLKNLPFQGEDLIRIIKKLKLADIRRSQNFQDYLWVTTQASLVQSGLQNRMNITPIQIVNSTNYINEKGKQRVSIDRLLTQMEIALIYLNSGNNILIGTATDWGSKHDLKVVQDFKGARIPTVKWGYF